MQMKAFKENKEKILTACVSPQYLSLLQRHKGVIFIRVGQEKCEARHFTALLHFIRKNCPKVCLLIADTLQRFNLLSEHSADPHFTLEYARKQAYLAGNIWIEKHHAPCKRILLPQQCRLVRWEEGLVDYDIEKYRIRVLRQLRLDEAYEYAMQQSIQEYQKRQNITHLSAEISEDYCRHYLVEECACILALALKGKKYILYPGKPQPVVQYTLEKLMSPPFSPSLTWVPLRFKWRIPLALQQHSSGFIRTTLFSSSPPLIQVSSQHLLMEHVLHTMETAIGLLPNMAKKDQFLTQFQHKLKHLYGQFSSMPNVSVTN